MIAVAAGVSDDQWQKDECKANIKSLARRAMTPYCSPDSCSPLGFCDSDCNAGRDACGPLANYHGVLEGVLPGGSYYFMLSGMVGSAVLPCVVEVLQYVSGNGYDFMACNSAAFPSHTHTQFGSSPFVDCLPMAVTDPNTFLRNTSSSASSSSNCSLPTWDAHDAELVRITTHNNELLLNATLASEQFSQPPPTFPSYRSLLLPLLPLLQAIFIYLGRACSTSTPSPPDGRVTPVAGRRSLVSGGGAVVAAGRMSQKLSGKQRDTVAVVPEPPPSVVVPVSTAASNIHIVETLHFWGFMGVTGQFVAVALVAQVSLAMLLSFRAEDAAASDRPPIPIEQVVCLSCTSLYATFHFFNSVVYWRSLVSNLVDVADGRVDPLEALDNFPLVKRLTKWYYDNFGKGWRGERGERTRRRRRAQGKEVASEASEASAREGGCERGERKGRRLRAKLAHEKEVASEASAIEGGCERSERKGRNLVALRSRKRRKLLAPRLRKRRKLLAPRSRKRRKLLAPRSRKRRSALGALVSPRPLRARKKSKCLSSREGTHTHRCSPPLPLSDPHQWQVLASAHHRLRDLRGRRAVVQRQLAGAVPGLGEPRKVPEAHLHERYRLRSLHAHRRALRQC
jgi:hypothetical protein